MKLKKCGAFTRMHCIMAVAALAAIAFVLLPMIAKRHARSSKVSCTNNLKQVGRAYRMWAIDNGDKYPAMVSTAEGGAKEWIEAGSLYTSFLVLSNELSTPKVLICPQEANPKRVVANTFAQVPPNSSWQAIPFTNNNNVSYFVGLDADEAEPQRILSGDDNFLVDGVRPRSGLLLLRTNSSVTWTKERHINYGNIGLADGSVQRFTSPFMSRALLNTGVATNRLVMP